MDCTFCLDCVHACPHDNVGILAVAPALDLTRDIPRSSVGRFAQRPDLAALVLLLVFGAFVNAGGMIAPMAEWQDRLIAQFGFHSTLPVVTTLLVLSLLILPPLLALLCGWLSHLFGRSKNNPDTDWIGLTCEFTMALAPLGIAMWAAHYLFHLVIAAPTVLPAIQRAATDLGLTWFGAQGWVISSVSTHDWLPPLRLLLLDAGLLLSLYIAWSTARRRFSHFRTVLGAFIPWGALAAVLFLAGIWISIQPMQMRGIAAPSGELR
jgi:hypothetical protein